MAVLGMLLLTPALMLWAFDRSALDGAYHRRLYAALGSARAAGLDEAALFGIGDMLVDYLKGARADLAMTATVNGAAQAVFNEREIAHMQDVRALFFLARRIGAALGALGLGLLAAGLLGRGWARRLKRAGLTGQVFWLALIAAFGIWAAADFDGAFRSFHAALFSNDLWLMNPETDLMIRMLPEKFFAAVAVHALGGVLVAQTALACAWGLPVAIARQMRRRETT